MPRVLWVVALMAIPGCGQKPEFEGIDEAGKFNSAADVEGLFREKEQYMKEWPDIVKKMEYDGSLWVKNIKAQLKFKGAAGLWVKGDLAIPGNVDAAGEGTMRFSGRVDGQVKMAGGVVWLERLPDKSQTKCRIYFTQPGIIIVSSATKAQLLEFQATKLTGSAEVVAMECDHEPGRWKTTWSQPTQGIHTLTVFAKMP